MIPSLFNPDPATTEQVLHLFCDPMSSFHEIAREFHTNVPALCLWLSKPDIARRLVELRSAGAERTRTVAALYLPRAIPSLMQIVEEFNYDASHRLDNPADPSTPMIQIRERESVRKSILLIYRLARFTDTPIPARAALHVTSAPSLSLTPSQMGARAGGGRTERAYAHLTAANTRTEPPRMHLSSASEQSEHADTYLITGSEQSEQTRVYLTADSEQIEHHSVFDMAECATGAGEPLVQSNSSPSPALGVPPPVASASSRCRETSESPAALATEVGDEADALGASSSVPPVSPPRPPCTASSSSSDFATFVSSRSNPNIPIALAQRAGTTARRSRAGPIPQIA